MSSNMDDNSAERIQAGHSSSGSGAQHSNLGYGKQYNNSGSGTQYNANKIEFVYKEKDTFLRDLRVTDPRDDKTRIERTKGNLFKDSYCWILDNSEFNQWRAEKRLLWVKGGPGKGKTMLLCGIIDELFALGYTSTFFFFCQGTDARLNTATSVLRGLLYLILDQNQPLLEMLRLKYDKAGARVFDDANGWDVLCKMVLAAVSHQSLQNVVVIIDAIDECTSGLDQLISFVIDLTDHVKVITSSRPVLRIDRGLAAALDDTKIYLSLELNDEVISVAVSSYITHKVDHLASLKSYDDYDKRTVNAYLATNANNTFLWVALICDQLADNRVAKRHTQRRLHKFPPGLNSLYSKILTEILELLDAEECTQVLTVMSIVSRPLHLAELASLLGNIEYLEEIVEECGSLLTVREGIVYFIHQSAKDFLVSQANTTMPLGILENHNLILSKLLHTMSNTLRRNIYQIDMHGIALDEISVPTPDPLALTRYACVYWADHFIEGNVGEQQFDEVYTFMTQHFLHWLEALSLLRSINEGILSMSKVLEIGEALEEPQEGKLLVRDAIRFIRYFRVPIESDPMQTYLSALVFSPRDTLIRRLFRAEEPQWPLKPAVNEGWGPCLQSLEVHGCDIKLGAFSAERSLLASISNKRNVMLWKVATGHCVRTLDTNEQVSAVALSENGALLASASNRLIQLWNTTTGHLVQSLNTCSPIQTLAFLPGGHKLATGLSNHTLELWNTKSSRCVYTVEGYSRSPPFEPTFSGDGSLVVLEFYDGMKVWQTTTRTCIKTIHKVWSWSVALSYNGSHLACLCEDGVKVFNLETDRRLCLENPSVKPSNMNTVAIAQNGMEIAIGLSNGDIHIWDATTNRSTRVLKGHNGHVTSVAFSKDERFLASSSTDRSTKIWDLTGHESDVRFLLPDSRSCTPSDLGLRRQKSNRKILDVIKAALPFVVTDDLPSFQALSLRTTEHAHTSTRRGGHSFDETRFKFQCCGCLLLLDQYHGSSVWDTTTGQCLKSGQRHSFASSETLYNNSIRVAKVAGGGDLIIIEDGTRKCLQTLEVRHSADGPMVISHKGYPPRLEAMRKGYGGVNISICQFAASGYRLKTNYGPIDLNAMELSGKTLLKCPLPQSLTKRHGDYDIDREDDWILKDGRRFLWLPTDYRPFDKGIDGSTLAMAYRSGRVIIIRFS